MRSAVYDDVPVRRPTALVTSFVDDLRVHRGPHTSLNVLPFRLAHAAEHAHQHLVRRVPRIKLPAQFRDPQAHAVGSEPRRDERELIAEPAPRAFTYDQRIPAT